MPNAPWRRRSTCGFTLIELSLVMLILAVLAVVVLPRVAHSTRLARESNLRAHLNGLRRGIGLFETHCGDLPAHLEDIARGTGVGLVGASGQPIDPAAYRGPYLGWSEERLPEDPMTRAADWGYDPETGRVWSISTDAALDGTAYSTW